MSRNRRKPPAEPAEPGRFRPFADLADRLEPPAAPPPSSPPPPRAPRPVADEDTTFEQAVADATPIERDAAAGPRPDPRPARLPDEGKEWKQFATDLMKGRTGFDISWSDEYVEGRRHEVTASTMKRLRGGRISFGAHLDLHGMTRDEARQRVERFIVEARTRDLGCVLLVHGRGKGSQGGRPVLKEKLVAWLTREGGIGAQVLAFATARPCDGGPGAVYVLLKKTPSV